MEVGPDSMFVASTFDEKAYVADCNTNYGIEPDFDWEWRNFGGQTEVARDFMHYSNIIFTNGNLDPWSTGGIKDFVNVRLPVYTI